MKRIIDRANIAGSNELGAEALSRPPEKPASRGTVVIADDDVGTRTLLCQVLTRAAFTVYAVENGKLACEAVRLRQPDVILLDWMMPVMDGLRAAKLLKADVETRAIPIVMITTHSQIEDRNLALEVGVQDFVTKPFDARELVACIEQQMRWRTIIITARATDRRGSVAESWACKARPPKRAVRCLAPVQEGTVVSINAVTISAKRDVRLGRKAKRATLSGTRVPNDTVVEVAR